VEEAVVVEAYRSPILGAHQVHQVRVRNRSAAAIADLPGARTMPQFDGVLMRELTYADPLPNQLSDPEPLSDQLSDGVVHQLAVIEHEVSNSTYATRE
jgi:hypothetical protein